MRVRVTLDEEQWTEIRRLVLERMGLEPIDDMAELKQVLRILLPTLAAAGPSARLDDAEALERDQWGEMGRLTDEIRESAAARVEKFPGA